LRLLLTRSFRRLVNGLFPCRGRRRGGGRGGGEVGKVLSEFVAEVARVAEEEVAVQFNDAQEMAVVPVP